jgi:cytochrome c-type biogenesis protein CcmH/NrfG
VVAHHRLASALRLEKREAEAEAHYLQIFRLAPTWAAPRFEMASMLEKAGQSQRSVALYEDGLRLDPSHTQARVNLALTLFRLRRYQEARPHLERALLQRSRSAELQAHMALIYEHLGRSADAVRHHREALRLRPDLVSSANNLAWILATDPDPAIRSPSESIRVATAIVEAGPGRRPEFLDTLAAGYAAAGRFEDAVEIAREAVKRADGRGDAALAEDIRARLAVYEAGQPFYASERGPSPSGRR